MLTNSEIKKLIDALLDCREKLLWLTSQNPINAKQEELIENSKELLIRTNQFLEEFYVQLPA
jgi:hypothetical protein